MMKKKLNFNSLKPKLFFAKNGRKELSSLDLDENVKNIKKTKSPLKWLVKGYKNVLGHFYPKFNIKMKQIIDFYGDSNLGSS